MTRNKEREMRFRKELQELLNRHGAEIKAHGDGTLAGLLTTKDITVVLHSMWDSENDCLLNQHIEFVL